MNIKCSEQQEQLRTDQTKQETVMGFIHSWSSTYLWVVAFIALLTIGPAGGTVNLCAWNGDVIESAKSVQHNIDYGGHLAYNVDDRPETVRYIEGTKMFDNFKAFERVWDEWIRSECAKALCNDEEKEKSEMTQSDCFNLHSTQFFKVKECAVLNFQGGCMERCGPFIAQSVKFTYQFVKCEGNSKKRYCWILLSASLFNLKDCGRMMQ